jgi:hypothetical protein
MKVVLEMIKIKVLLIKFILSRFSIDSHKTIC